MKKLVINGLYIYSLKEKKAYHTEFKDGINFVTSCKENGNKRGKSVIMKSIYSTLGADCSFDPKWDFANKTTILDININDDKYYFIRSNNYFRIVDSNFKTIFETTRRIELSKKLSELFDFYIELPNRENRLELTPPTYMYLLNYVDQTGLNCTTFSSFKGLAQYSNYKKYALLSHFGVFNEEYYDLDKKLKDSNDELEANKKEANDLDKLIQKIEKELSGNNYSLDMTSLNHEIELSKNEYKLLNCLIKNSGQIVTKGQLLEALWDKDGAFVDENTVAVNIRRLREKIEDIPSEPVFIKNIRGIGYRWNEEIS